MPVPTCSRATVRISTAGIEIYRGKPIFYSLGHLIFENETVSRAQWEALKKTSLGPEATPADYYDARSGREHLGEWLDYAAAAFRWRNAVAVVDFAASELQEIRLYPIDLGFKRARSQRGRPLLAHGEVAREVLELFRRLSAPFGTDVEIREEIGLIRASS